MLTKLLKLLNRDLARKTWEREVEHSFFETLVYFGSLELGRSYWEAVVPTAQGGSFLAYMRGTPNAPTRGEEAFCRLVANDHGWLLAACSAHLPDAAAFRLESIEVPPDGDRTQRWSARFAGADEAIIVVLENDSAIGAGPAG